MDLWHYYKKAVASFWTVEEVDFQGDLSDWDHRMDGERVSSVLAQPARKGCQTRHHHRGELSRALRANCVSVWTWLSPPRPHLVHGAGFAYQEHALCMAPHALGILLKFHGQCPHGPIMG